jgi:hypothetical protein
MGDWMKPVRAVTAALLQDLIDKGYMQRHDDDRSQLMYIA